MRSVNRRASATRPERLFERWRRALRRALDRRRWERDLDRELRSHVDLKVEENLTAGMDPATARRVALARFGSLEAIKQECREQERWYPVESFLRDLRIGARSLVKSPVFSLAAVLTLAVGLGGTTALFSVVRGVLLRPLPLPEPERLVRIYETDRVQGTQRENASFPDFDDLRRESRAFESLAAYGVAGYTLSGDGGSERLLAARVSPSYFSVLAVDPVLGRAFSPAEEEAGSDRVAVLGHDFWRTRFAGDAGVVGTRLVIDGTAFTVVGVMPQEARLPENREQLWMPLAPNDLDRIRGRHAIRVYARLASGVSLDQAQAEADLVMERLEAAHPEDNRGRGAFVEPLHASLVRGVRPALRLLMISMCAVLLVACVNVANLLLARGATRRREIAVRYSLGATRTRLLRQLWTESLLIAGAGAALGFLLAFGGLELLLRTAPAGLPRIDEVGLDGAAAAVGLVATGLTWIVFGLVPALRGSRGPMDAAGPGRGALPATGRRLRGALVASELALATLLLLVAGLMFRSIWNLRGEPLGYEARGLVSASVELLPSKYPFPQGWPVLEWPQGTELAQSFVERVRALPGVESAALSYAGPTDGSWTTRITVEGRADASAEQLKESHFRAVGDGYFETIGAPLRAGRTFRPNDRPGVPLVAIINRAFERRHFPQGDALGEKLLVYGAPREVVGVVEDVRFLGLDQDPEPAVYLPLPQNPLGSMTVTARAAGDPASLVPELRAVLSSLDPDLPLYDVQVVEDAVASSLDQRRFTLGLLIAFALMTLVLATSGVYGVLSQLVAQRRAEIGLRIALGARGDQVVVMVLRAAMSLVAAGLVLGLLAGLAFARWTASLLYGVRPLDPSTVVFVLVVLGAAALLASWWPARRAVRIDPQKALSAG